jgi:predicted nucleic acid-binding protein
MLAIEPITLEVHLTGLMLAQRYRLSIYDTMIAAAALHADCDVLFSEDMHHGMVIDNRLRIVNPFRATA